MDTIRCDYQPKLLPFAVAGLFCAGVAVLMAKFAFDNDRGMIINGLIRLDTGDATALLWGLTAVCGGGALLSVIGIVRAFGPPQEVVLDRHAISAPKNGLSRSIETVPYSEITDMRLTQVKSQHFLAIHHHRGKLTIACSMLPSEYDFDALAETVYARCLAGRR